MSDKAEMPGYWRFVWMFWMQPVTLHYCLQKCGMDVFLIWKLRRNLALLDPAYRQYIGRLLFNFCLTPLLFLVLAWIATIVFHWPIRLDKVIGGMLQSTALGVTLGLAFGVMGGLVGWLRGGLAFAVAGGLAGVLPFSVTFGAAFGVAGGVAGCIADYVAGGVAVGLAVGLVIGIALGMASRVAVGIAFGEVLGVLFGVTMGIGISLMGGMVGFIMDGAANGLKSGVMSGLMSGMASGMTYLLLILGIPIYFVEALWQALLPRSTSMKAAASLHLTPILYHDLSYLPHPGLKQHILTAAECDASLARHVIEVALRSHGQRKQAVQALATLMTGELYTLFQAKNWPALIDMNGFWLDASQPLLKPIAECAQFMFAAQQATSNHLRHHSLQQAQARLHALANQLLPAKEALAQTLATPLRDWQVQVAQELEQATRLRAEEIPNPFTVGNPIQPGGLWSQTLFRGRERTAAQVEQLLNDANNHAMALIGPRRCGKSSLINMLPVLLPDTIIVQFDLQDNPADTPMRFYQGLSKVAQTQARRSHQLALPGLDESAASPIEALKQWFEQLENFTAVPRILLCIDEFERLETLFPDKAREFPQFMGLIRATIQHKRRLRLLVAGAAPFADLGPIWNDHFINLRELKIGYFDHATATGLLTKPMPEFPDGTISQEVADAVFARSQGQPFLTQAYGYGLVQLLNDEKRKQATLPDLERVDPEILQSYNYYFRGIWQEVPPAGQAVLEALAHGQSAEMDTPTRLWLRRRMVITEDGLLAIPLFGRWIREKDQV